MIHTYADCGGEEEEGKGLGVCGREGEGWSGNTFGIRRERRDRLWLEGLKREMMSLEGMGCERGGRGVLGKH